MSQVYDTVIHNFKGYTPLILIINYWLYFPWYIIYLVARFILNSLYLWTPCPIWPLPTSLSPLVTTSSLHLWVCCFFVIFSSLFFRFHREVTSHSVYIPLSAFFHLAECPPTPSMLLLMANFHSFYDWLVFHCVYIHLLYPFICWWTLPLLLYLDNCDFCCCGHWGAYLFEFWGVHIFLN